MRLHVVDGTYELFRAHFSKRPDQKNAQGRDVKATVGVVWSILSLLRDPDEQVTHIAIAFDNPIRSFRNDLFAGYKTDEGVPPELLAQFDPVEEAMAAIGVVVWSMNEWEADDALATAAARWSQDVDQVRIMTPDKDLGQCVTGTRVVQVDRMRRRVIDEAALLAARGIAPASVPDYLALVGDSADGIPGVPGFGKKTSAALLREYGHLERLPLRAADWKPTLRGSGALATTLSTHIERAHLYRRLATLVRTVPLPQSLDDLRWLGVPPAKFDDWCQRIGASEALRTYASGPATEAPGVSG
ncbi:MAG: flap endonuclease [Myxococcota bacterium]|nr:flap endonuclease [Myxococcota bacterium]